MTVRDAMAYAVVEVTAQENRTGKHSGDQPPPYIWATGS